MQSFITNNGEPIKFTFLYIQLSRKYCYKGPNVVSHSQWNILKTIGQLIFKNCIPFQITPPGKTKITVLLDYLWLYKKQAGLKRCRSFTLLEAFIFFFVMKTLGSLKENYVAWPSLQNEYLHRNYYTVQSTKQVHSQRS